jgi:hypothetical protein
VGATYAAGEAQPTGFFKGHSNVMVLLEEYLPDGHPDLAELLSNPANNSLPDWHPELNSIVIKRGAQSPGLILSLLVVVWFVLVLVYRLINKLGASAGASKTPTPTNVTYFDGTTTSTTETSDQPTSSAQDADNTKSSSGKKADKKMKSFPVIKSFPIGSSDIGSRVCVKGFDGAGTLRSFSAVRMLIFCEADICAPRMHFCFTPVAIRGKPTHTIQ